MPSSWTCCFARGQTPKPSTPPVPQLKIVARTHVALPPPQIQVADRVAAAHWGWIIVRCLLAGLFFYGFGIQDRTFVLTAFCTLFLLDLYSSFRQPHLTRSICSAVTKLEERVEELEQDRSAPNARRPPEHLMASTRQAARERGLRGGYWGRRPGRPTWSDSGPG